MNRPQNRAATADARLVRPDGKLYAHVSATRLVFPTPTPK